MSKERIAIIIVTFNSEKYISNCLRSVIDNFVNNYLYKIIIIDNKSRDKTVGEIKKFTKNNSNIYLICKDNNQGFAKSVNLGLKMAGEANYFLLLNPDVVTNNTSITNLVLCIKKNQAGIAGGNTLNKDGVGNGSYFRLPNILVGLFDFTNLRKFISSDYWHKYFYYLDRDYSKLSSFYVDVVTGGYMLISKETIKRLGRLDEAYFMYLEDVDFCLRAKKANIKVVHCNNSNITHFSGGSSNNKDGIRHSAWLWSRKMYYLKHFGLIANIIIQPIFLLDDVFILLKKSLSI